MARAIIGLVREDALGVEVRETVTVRVDLYGIIRDAVEDGVRYGWRRAHKHDDNPPEDRICDEIIDRTVDALMERIDPSPELDE